MQDYVSRTRQTDEPQTSTNSGCPWIGTEKLCDEEQFDPNHCRVCIMAYETENKKDN